MHITKIEEFSFDHGQHFNNATGEYHSLNPHTLGRPLTHTEMDYNLIYQKQTLNGFRICGSNNDLTLALSDLGGRLEFTQISNTDADWARFQAAGLFDGQFVWNPVGGALPTTTTTAVPTTTTTTAAPTTTTTTAAPTTTTTTAAPTTTTTTAAPTTTTTTAAPTYSLSVNGPVNEGGNMVFTLTTTGLSDGDVVPFGLGGTATIGVDYSDVNPKEFVIANNSATYTVTTFADNTTEAGGNETISLTLAAFDSQGYGTFSESVTGEIIDTSQTPTTTTTTAAPTTTTTTAAPTTTTTTTTAAPELAYFFHLGNGTYPYAQDLIGGTWYKADNSVAADFAEGFADALANPGSYETINSVSSISSGDQFVFPASQAQNFFWLLIPDSYGIPDLTGVARLADTQNNINDVAAQVLATTVNGQPYKLYRVNLAQALAGVTIQYNE